MSFAAARPGRPAPLFGREEIIEEVDRLLARAADGEGQGLLILGVEGGGKSHLLRAIEERGIRRRFRVFTGRGQLAELPQPFSLVRDLLESARETEAGPTDDRAWDATNPTLLGPISGGPSVLPEPAGEAARTLDALDEFDRLLAPLVERDVAGLETSREELLGRIEAHFQTVARSSPLLLAIDDLHLADDSSLEFLTRFAIDLADYPVAVVATAGVGPAAPDRTRTAVEVVSRSPAFRSTVLRPLTISEATEFVRWIIGGRDPDPQDVLRWHTQTEGNPLLIEQLVRTVTGFQSAEGTATSAQRASLAESLVARVEELPRRAQRVLAYATVLGREFDFALLRTVAGLDEEAVTEAVDRLVQDGFLREKGREVYEVVTEAARARVYADLTETHRRILHEKAGLALEAQGGAPESELARHFYLGHDHPRAFKYNVAAAETATRAFAFETAATHLTRALEAERRGAGRDPVVEIRLLTELGRLWTEIGVPQRSESVLTEAVTLARSLPGHEIELGRALLGLAWSRYERGEFPTAEELATEAWGRLAAAGTTRDTMAAHRVSGLACWRRGALKQAAEHQRAVLEIAEREGTPLEQGHALVDVANVIEPSDAQSLQLSLELYGRAAELFAQGENHVALARVRMNRAVTLWEAGRTDEALKEFELAIRAAEAAHSPRWIGWCEFNLAQMQAELGQTAVARTALERAVRVLAPVGDLSAEQQIWMARGMIDHAEGAYDAAEANYQKSLEMARDRHVRADSAEVELRLAWLSHDRGNDLEARARLAGALADGLLEYRPDFRGRVAGLERAIREAPGAGG